MKRQFFILGILINTIFYSCSAVSSVKSTLSCRNDNNMYGRYKLSPWKTVEFRLYFKNGREATHGNVHVAHPKNR